MNKASKIKTLIAAVAIPLIVGGVGAFLTKDGYGLYELMQKPLLSPPGWVFPVVWTLLYIMMGAASYLVYTSQASPPRKKRAMRIYALQLAANFLWPLLFFGQGLYLAAFLLLVLLWFLVLVCALLFHYISPRAGKLMLPYLIWLTFAAYLNLGVVLLN